MRTTIMSAMSAIGAAVGSAVLASSHCDAPLIKQDPQANITDVYAFIGTRYNDDKQQMLNVVVNVRPFSEPGDGPHYDRFASDAVYCIHLTDPSTGVLDLTYEFAFTDPNGSYLNPFTIFSYGVGTEVGPIVNIGDNRQNFAQFYSVRRVLPNGTGELIGTGTVAPPNVGKNVTPAYNDPDGVAVSGATTFNELGTYTQLAIANAPSGEVFFAGPLIGDIDGDDEVNFADLNLLLGNFNVFLP